MQSSGYSGTPLSKKLGLKEGFRIKLINAPINYFELIGDVPAKIVMEEDLNSVDDFIHLFSMYKEEYLTLLPQLKLRLSPNGMMWVSWPKKSSNVQTDLTEYTVRNYALEIGLVDIKVCAVDETWSALKLVIPVKDR